MEPADRRPGRDGPDEEVEAEFAKMVDEATHHWHFKSFIRMVRKVVVEKPDERLTVHQASPAGDVCASASPRAATRSPTTRCACEERWPVTRRGHGGRSERDGERNVLARRWRGVGRSDRIWGSLEAGKSVEETGDSRV